MLIKHIVFWSLIASSVFTVNAQSHIESPSKPIVTQVDPIKPVDNTGKAVVGNRYECTVTHYVDGDTVDADCKKIGIVRIRSSDIDSPEKGQPFYKESTQFAKDYMSNKGRINIIVLSKQPASGYYKARIIAKIYDTNRGLYSRKIASAGLAWAYKDSAVVKPLVAKAKAAKRGLWVDENPINPADWRATKGIRAFLIDHQNKDNLI